MHKIRKCYFTRISKHEPNCVVVDIFEGAPNTQQCSETVQPSGKQKRVAQAYLIHQPRDKWTAAYSHYHVNDCKPVDGIDLQQNNLTDNCVMHEWWDKNSKIFGKFSQINCAKIFKFAKNGKLVPDMHLHFSLTEKRHGCTIGISKRRFDCKILETTTVG